MLSQEKQHQKPLFIVISKKKKKTEGNEHLKELQYLGWRKMVVLSLYFIFSATITGMDREQAQP